jgi:sucrose-6-phosphate hydrolase SacC (GH32 family)
VVEILVIREELRYTVIDAELVLIKPITEINALVLKLKKRCHKLRKQEIHLLEKRQRYQIKLEINSQKHRKNTAANMAISFQGRDTVIKLNRCYRLRVLEKSPGGRVGFLSIMVHKGHLR